MSKARPGSASLIAASSPGSSEPALLAIGKLRHAHGVHGEILMEVYTDFPERLVPGMVLYLNMPGATLRLSKRRSHKGGLLMTFEGYDTPEAIGQYRNQVLYVKAEDRPPLPEGEYYHHQLINLHVTTDAGESLGNVTEILETGASDVLVIRPEFGPEVLIPIAQDFIHTIDLQRGEIIVHLIPGMLAEEP